MNANNNEPRVTERQAAKAAPGLWADPTIPKSGWRCVKVDDLEAPTAVCEMCGVAEVRYLHRMVHADDARTLAVGCVCAGKLERDPSAAVDRERIVRLRAARLGRFLRRRWWTSAQGNPFTNLNGRRIVLFAVEGGWRFAIDGRRSRFVHPDPTTARRAAFDGLEWLRSRTPEVRAGARNR